MYKLNIMPAAIADQQEATQYIADRPQNPIAAANLLDEIEKCYQTLEGRIPICMHFARILHWLLWDTARQSSKDMCCCTKSTWHRKSSILCGWSMVPATTWKNSKTCILRKSELSCHKRT